MNKIFVFTDGGALGNPGPAAIGAIIKNKETKRYSIHIGQATNNEAEYEALIFALKKIKQIFGRKKIKNLEIEFFLDSELVVNQLKGKYKILEKNLQPLFISVWNLKTEFKNVNFSYIPREENKEADNLVKEKLRNL